MRTQTGGDTSSKKNRRMDGCVDSCIECYKVCTETLPHCLELGGRHAEASHITLLLNCARICQLSADFMLTGSPLHVHTCKACAEICQQCADDCASMTDDEQMKRCAEICKRCAESCRQMSVH